MGRRVTTPAPAAGAAATVAVEGQRGRGAVVRPREAVEDGHAIRGREAGRLAAGLHVAAAAAGGPEEVVHNEAGLAHLHRL